MRSRCSGPAGLSGTRSAGGVAARLVAGFVFLAVSGPGAVANEPERPLLHPRAILQSWTNATAPSASPPAVPSTAGEDPLVLKLSRDGYRLMETGSFNEGRRKFDEALSLDPGSRQARHGLATVLIKTGQNKEAIELLTVLAREFPDDYTVKNNLAWLYATTKDTDLQDPGRAVALAQEALLIAPENFHVWSTLSEAHYVAGAYQRAARAAEQALRMSVEQRAGEASRREYTRQLKKCLGAARALENSR